MFGSEAGSGVGGVIVFLVVIFLIIAGIMSIFIPFWVFRIRNEVISMNMRLKKMIDLLGENHSKHEISSIVETEESKICPECGHKNPIKSSVCASCRQRL